MGLVFGIYYLQSGRGYTTRHRDILLLLPCFLLSTVSGNSNAIRAYRRIAYHKDSTIIPNNKRTAEILYRLSPRLSYLLLQSFLFRTFGLPRKSRRGRHGGKSRAPALASAGRSRTSALFARSLRVYPLRPPLIRTFRRASFGATWRKYHTTI